MKFNFCWKIQLQIPLQMSQKSEIESLQLPARKFFLQLLFQHLPLDDSRWFHPHHIHTSRNRSIPSNMRPDFNNRIVQIRALFFSFSRRSSCLQLPLQQLTQFELSWSHPQQVHKSRNQSNPSRRRFDFNIQRRSEPKICRRTSAQNRTASAFQ